MPNQATTVVYRAQNLVNGKTYIGYTGRGLEARKKAHLNDARNGRGHVFHAALRKYGPENFIFEVLADFDGDEDLAKLYEYEAIAKYKPEYNLTHGGDGGTLHVDSRKKISAANLGRKMPASHGEKRRAYLVGRKHTPETKAKMSAVHKGHAPTTIGPLSEETKRKISAANKGQMPWTKGKKRSAETIAKIRAQRWNHSPESLERIRDARKRAWAAPTEAMLEAVRANNQKAAAAKKIAVCCVTEGRVFPGCSDADRFYGFKIGLVSRILKGTAPNKTGLVFAYHPRGI